MPCKGKHKGNSAMEKAIRKEMKEHPWATREVAARIARDHRRR